MKKVIITIVVVLVIQVAVALMVMYSGVYDISVLNHDNAVVNWALDTGMTRSPATKRCGCSWRRHVWRSPWRSAGRATVSTL